MSKWNKYYHTAPSPCLDCDTRKPLCHSSCKDYKDYRGELDRESEQKLKGQQINFAEYRRNAVSKILKKKMKRRRK